MRTIRVASSKRLLAPLLSLSLMLWGAPPAHAGQMNAEDEPRVTGPLELAEGMPKCNRQVERQQGQVAAVAKSCFRFYTFDPAAETNANEDYGVIWLQSTLNGHNGWCALKADSDIIVPEGTQIHGRAPKPYTEIRARRFLRTTLAVDAGSDGEYHTETPGSVSKGYIAYPRVLRAWFNSDRTVFRLRWLGTTPRKLAFVSGIEIAWNAVEGPPESATFQMNFDLRKKSRC